MATLFIVLCIFLLGTRAIGQLSQAFYDESCPQFEKVVHDKLTQVVANDSLLAPSLLKLQFRDCFPHGCRASILLEKNAHFPNSERIFDLINEIKSGVEAVCPTTVSCTDILAVAARDSVSLLGGPSWRVVLGRRDAVTSNQSAGYKQITSPSTDLSKITAMFGAAGFIPNEMVALIGAHTIGQAPCKDFKTRIYNETNIDPNFATSRRSNCPFFGGDANKAPLDDLTPSYFDNNYFRNLLARRGLLPSDQMLFDGGPLDAIVKHYSINSTAFFEDFVAGMKKMANIDPLTGSKGVIRKICRGRE